MTTDENITSAANNATAVSSAASVENHFLKIDEVIFGSWSEDTKNPTRNRGLLERLRFQEFLIKVCLFGIAIADVKGISLGTVGELISHLFAVVVRR